jgi:hypothetical protein
LIRPLPSRPPRPQKVPPNAALRKRPDTNLREEAAGIRHATQR